jgi:hypothetical protein
MNWEFLPAKTHFDSYRNLWDGLNRSQGDHILLDSEFVSALLRHFGHDGINLAVNQDSKRPAMALVTSTRWGLQETFQPSQAPLGLIVFGYRGETLCGLQELTRALPGYALQLAVLQQDPEYSAFPGSSEESSVEFINYIQTGSLKLEGNFGQYWETRADDN